MKNFGDVTKINGCDVPPVDCIIGGSPCQDLSVAGLRAGLDGERSGLFVEQIRIVKEMRSKYVRVGGSNQLVRLPRYCVWENVPGAFSSNGGKDFQAVLTEFVKVCEPDAPDVPLPEMYGKNLTFKTGGVDGCDCDEVLKLIEAGKINTEPLITHTFPFKDIEQAYEIFENKLDGVIKIAIVNE